jgi:hypothetical protein
VSETTVDAIRRLAVYVGPIVLALMAARAIQSAACGVQVGVSLGRGPGAIVLMPVLLVLSIYASLTFRDAVGRAAFALMALQYLLLTFSAVSGVAQNPLVLSTLMTTAMVLLAIAGARAVPQSRRVVAAAVFVVMFVVGLGARSFAVGLSGQRSVLNQSAICQ